MIKDCLLAREMKLAVVGLGYVGLPIAHAFGKLVPVIGFDTNAHKVELYRKGVDPSGEVGDDEIASTQIELTSNENDLSKAGFFIVAVPTPVNADKTPDLHPVVEASRVVGRQLRRGAIVVFESTVYPGVTEDVCVPVLEQASGLRCGEDFWVGYSPERINPGDKVHRLHNITKIVSGMDSRTMEEIAQVYELVIEAGVHRAPNIKVAEAAKLCENTQRDINIAFMNELSIAFDRMGISTWDVLEAMNTKWNALGFAPGLVGGHCIGVDPYYFIYQAENLGYHSQIILAGRKINNSMGEHVAQAAIKKMILAGSAIREARIFILGATFKENCADLRNSLVGSIVSTLREYGADPYIVDPVADCDELASMYGSDHVVALAQVQDADCLIAAVSHDAFRSLSTARMMSMYAASHRKRVLVDVKHIFPQQTFEAAGFLYWSL